MQSLSLESLGLSKEELTERLLDRLTDAVMTESFTDYDGDEMTRKSPLMRKLQSRIKEQIDAVIVDIGDKLVAPQITKMIEETSLQATNAWGEPKGEPITFTEYLVQRANAYICEEVNHRGEAKNASRDSYWSKSGTRITHMIHQHFDYEIKQAMTKAYEQANKSITDGIQKAVNQELAKISVKLKTDVVSK
jgi:hypothetical protein